MMRNAVSARDGVLIYRQFRGIARAQTRSVVKLHRFNGVLENGRPKPSVFAETVPTAYPLLTAQ